MAKKNNIQYTQYTQYTLRYSYTYALYRLFFKLKNKVNIKSMKYWFGQ